MNPRNYFLPLVMGYASLMFIGCSSGNTRPSEENAAEVPVYLDTNYSFRERAADLVSRMTLEEKMPTLFPV